MKVAVIGSGISGIAAAYYLQGSVDQLVLFEKADRLGGHTDSHRVCISGKTYNIDTGFIVFNNANYPSFSAWLDLMGIASQSSDMSFGVRNLDTGLEYGTRNISALLAQRKNLFSRRFWRMLWDLRRFFRDAADVDLTDLTLAEFCKRQKYSEAFWEDHLLPMCSALWSLPSIQTNEISASHVIRFMANHKMLQLAGRPEWRVVKGGSNRYLEAFAAQFSGKIRLSDPVVEIIKRESDILLNSASGQHVFDKVVIACHSDEALAILQTPSTAERQILQSIAYQENRVVLHQDESVMPTNHRAWSSWNATISAEGNNACQVTYWMNPLQNLSEKENFFVTLNPKQELESVLAVEEYSHPIFTYETEKTKKRWAEISGIESIYYSGAYWGWGFHEDGFSSGKRCAEQILRSSVIVR